MKGINVKGINGASINDTSISGRGLNNTGYTACCSSSLTEYCMYSSEKGRKGKQDISLNNRQKAHIGEFGRNRN